jgi:ribonucleoside-diphosphate reductase alpha chain
MRFEPSGYTNNRQIPIAKSIIDYIFRWLGIKFLERAAPAPGGKDLENGSEAGAATLVSAEPAAAASAATAASARVAALETQEKTVFHSKSDAPPCHDCGEIMVRNGACYACTNCGATSGCS